MIVGVSVDLPITDKTVEFKFAETDNGFKQVLSNATIDELRPDRDRIRGLIIPKSSPSVDYDFRHFIEHIRIDRDEVIARLPIIVFFTGNEEQQFGFSVVKSLFREELFKGIGVVESKSPCSNDLVTDFDPEAWEVYQKQAAIEPHYDQGRHDQANTWGAYTAAESIYMAYPTSQNERIVSQFRTDLAEDTFYKRKMQRGFSDPVNEQRIVELRHLKSRLAKRLSGNGPILIVEDQLENGWEDVYKVLLSASECDVEIDFAATEEEAKKKFNSSYQLVLLDIRLAPDRDTQCQEEGEQNIENLGGVRLAKFFRETCSTVPIVAATASNKSWTLEALLERGIDAYWVKGAPDSVKSIEQGFLNVFDFYKKLETTIKWSHRTRPWLERFYSTAEVVENYSPENGGRLKEKAKSLHALLSRAFSPFSNDMSNGLQMNLAYLVAWSGMNDVVTSIFNVEQDHDTGEAVWYLVTRVGREAFITKKLISAGEGQSYKYVIHDGSETQERDNFPDTLIAKKLLSNKGLPRQSRRFWGHHREVRNGLPQIHGKTESSGTSSESVSLVADEDISELIEILKTLVNAHLSDLTEMAST